MGDGALYIILPPAGTREFSVSCLTGLANNLWNLKRSFSEVVLKALDDVPVAELPRRIRFGLSRGPVYELKKPGTRNSEYIGFSINLASRLQNYCPDLGFIASARLMIPNNHLERNGYTKVIATNLRGFSNEVVIVDRNEYEGLDDNSRNSLFADPEDLAEEQD